MFLLPQFVCPVESTFFNVISTIKISNRNNQSFEASFGCKTIFETRMGHFHFIDIISYPDPQILNGCISISDIQWPKRIFYEAKIS